MSESTETVPYLVIVVVVVVVVIIGLFRYFGEDIIDFFKGLYQGGVSIFPPEQEIKPGKAIWEFNFPVFEYKDRRLFSPNLYYSYSDGEWYWSFDKEEWIASPDTEISGRSADKEDEDFIKTLGERKIDYKEGLNLIIKRVLGEGEGLIKVWISTEKADMDNRGEFTFRYLKTPELPSETEIFNFRFFGNRWEWRSKDVSADKWIDVSTPNILGGYYYGEPVKLIFSLRNKKFYDGAEIIFSGVPGEVEESGEAGEAGETGEVEKTCEDCGKDGQSCTPEECSEISGGRTKYNEHCVFEQGLIDKLNKCLTYPGK